MSPHGAGQDTEGPRDLLPSSPRSPLDLGVRRVSGEYEGASLCGCKRHRCIPTTSEAGPWIRWHRCEKPKLVLQYGVGDAVVLSCISRAAESGGLDYQPETCT